MGRSSARAFEGRRAAAAFLAWRARAQHARGAGLRRPCRRPRAGPQPAAHPPAHPQASGFGVPGSPAGGLVEDAARRGGAVLGRSLAAGAGRPEAAAAAPPLLELVDLVARGTDAAADAGSLLLTGQSRLLWEAALRIAPAEAIHISLGDLRVPDTLDPANSIAWCPAAHLAASPRPHVRMLGLTSGAWPRAESEDPILPDHILPRRGARKRVDHRARPADVRGHRERERGPMPCRAGGAARPARCSRRARCGRMPVSGRSTRTRIPLHAFSEADRLLARPREAIAAPLVAASRQCWEGWRARTRHRA